MVLVCIPNVVVEEEPLLPLVFCAWNHLAYGAILKFIPNVVVEEKPLLYLVCCAPNHPTCEVMF